MQGINKELNTKILKECAIKNALNSAKAAINDKKTGTRRKIEDIKAKRELENYFI